MTQRTLRMLARSTKAASLAVLGISLSSGCSFDGVRRFVGQDTSKRPQVCLLVAPAGMPPSELHAAVADVISRVAAQHGRVTGFIGNGPSAAAFPRISFDEDAHRGGFASTARNQGARDRDAHRWGNAALRELSAQIEATEQWDGLDLLGGLDQCARALAGARRSPTVVVVSNGLHRTVDLDLGDDRPDIEAFASSAADALPEPLLLRLPTLSRLDPGPIGWPPDRLIARNVAAAWTRTCEELGDRCTTDTTGG